MFDINVTAKDFASSILESDIMQPCQFFERIKTQPSTQPEKRLMLAVMQDAVATLHKCLPGVTRRQRRLLKEVEEWFASADTAWPFSFQNICAALDLDADYLRLGLDRWKARQLAQQNKQSSASVRSPFRRINGRRHTLSAYGRSQQPRRKAT
jgi:hypothetical protein